MSYNRNMKQTATYWEPAGNDGFGGYTFGEPMVIMCRWEDKAVMFRDAQGREAVSDAIVYTDQPVVVGGYLALGDYYETDNPIGLGKEIRNFSNSPNLSNTVSLNKAIL